MTDRDIEDRTRTLYEAARRPNEVAWERRDPIIQDVWRSLATRYRLALTAELRDAILLRIADAPDGHHPNACLIEQQFAGRERWLVSIGPALLHLVVARGPDLLPVLITFLPPFWRRL